MLHGWHYLTSQQRKTLQDAIITGIAGGGPYHLEIHPTHRCNAKCYFCCSKHYRQDYDLPLDLFRKLILGRGSGDLNFIRFSGGGEPLLHPEFDEFLRLIHNSSVKGFDLITNGILLKNFDQQLIENGMRSILVSLNELDKDLYVDSMNISPATHGRVIDGVRSLVDVRNRYSSSARIILQFFVTSKNYHQIVDMYKFAVDLGVDQVDIKSLFSPASEIEIDNIPNTGLQWLEEQLIELIHDDIESGCRIMRISLSYIDEQLNNRMYLLQRRLLDDNDNFLPDFAHDPFRIEYCYMPYYSATIDADGQVYSCCMKVGNGKESVGNLIDDSLDDIWTGERYQKVREQMRYVYLLGDSMEYSPRLHTQLFEKCVKRYQCHMAFDLADTAFYIDTAKRFEHTSPIWEQLRARGGNLAIRSVHHLRNLQQNFKH